MQHFPDVFFGLFHRPCIFQFKFTYPRAAQRGEVTAATKLPAEVVCKCSYIGAC